ncbi:cyclic nucleotide-binding-like protein [Powellomyces hirtus]|nr:cyclic nucleotide-binding-like protein [Powellomyces hirtus]
MAAATLARSFSADFRSLGLPVGDTAALLALLADKDKTILALSKKLETIDAEKAKLLTTNKVLRDHLQLVCQLQDQLQTTMKAYDGITTRVQDHLRLTQQLHIYSGDDNHGDDEGAATDPTAWTSPEPPRRGGPGTPSLARRVDSVARPVYTNGSIIALLKMFPLFNEFPHEVLLRLAQSSYEMYRKPGQVIITKGETGAEIFFLEKGDVHVMASGDDGTADVPLAKLRDKSFFGELGVLFDKPRTANVQAFTECFLVVLTKQKINDALNSFPELQKQLELFAHDRNRWWDAREYKDGFGMEFISNIARQDLTMLPIFAAASDQFLENLANRVTSEICEAGGIIIATGDDSDCIFFIIRGSAQVMGANNQVHAEMGPGSFFGELGVILNIKRTANIKAKETCFLLKLTKESLSQAQDAYPDMKKMIQEVVDERYALYKDRMQSTAKDAEQFHVEVGKQQLTKLPIFQGLDDNIVGELALLMEQTPWKSGQNIIQAGHRADSMFFLASGEVDVLSEFGEQIDKAKGPDAWFGEVALLQDVPRTATVRARTDCSTFVLKKNDFMDSLKKNPTIAERIEETARERLQAHLMRSILA